MKKDPQIKETIYLLKKTGKTALLKYQVQNFYSVSFTDTFIRNFEGLGFSSEEKKTLTQEQRMFLAKFRNINLNSLKDYSSELIKKIVSNKSDHIQIEAKEFGVYICMAAIFSGRIPVNKDIEFVFKTAPIALFPKKLMKCTNALDNCHVTYSDNSENWLDQYQALTCLPTELKAA